MSRFSMVSVASSPFVEDPSNLENDDIECTPTRLRPINDAEVSSLNEKIYQLQFQLQNLEQDRQMDRVQHESSLRDMEKKLKAEGQRADAAESDQSFLFNKTKELSDKLEKQRQDASIAEQGLNGHIRVLESELLNLEEDLDQTRIELNSVSSLHRKEAAELHTQNKALLRDREDQVQEIQSLLKELSTYRSKSVSQEEQIYKLSSQVSQLESQIGDTTDAEQLKKDLSEQLRIIAQLQDKVDKQSVEIKSLTEIKLLAGVVERERDSFEEKSKQVPILKDHIDTLEDQLLLLNQEKQSWTAYLDKNEHTSPEEIVRSLMQERLENVNLLGRLGHLEAELSAKSDSVNLESVDLEKLQAELQETKDKLTKEANQRARLEKLKDLASNEIELLRSQVQDYESESKAKDNSIDDAKNQKIANLEQLLAQYRDEAQNLTATLSQKESLVNSLSSPLRKLQEGDTGNTAERLSEALRKNRNLQVELDSSNSKLKVLGKDLDVLKKQVEDLKRAKNTPTERVLQLRDNPTSKYEAIKQSMLDTLKLENESLHAELQNNTPRNDKLVPHSALERIRLEMKDLERSAKEQSKRADRLKEVFGKKTLEFRESVFALLGYQIDLLPNKKVRAKSIYSEHLFTFVPDPKSKNKFIGLDEGEFDAEIENLIMFWIKERRDIPCFLAALNLELYEKSTKAGRF